MPMQNFMLNQPYSMYDFGWCNLEMDAWINHETGLQQEDGPDLRISHYDHNKGTVQTMPTGHV